MSYPVVNSFNEWDPLEEIIVGRLEGGVVMPWERGFEAMIPLNLVDEVRQYHSTMGGQPFAKRQLQPAQAELDEFIHILEAEGVTVKRPDPVDHSVPFKTPDFSSPGGNAQADPRDVLIVIGNEIIETGMSWRARAFEFRAYRRLVTEYFKQGAKWTTSPKPMMSDALYKKEYKRGQEWVTTEVEPSFDAADIARFGKDLFVQRSHVTNEFAVEWLRRHLGSNYNVHLVEFEDDRAVHIDATFVPLAPGKVMVNPDRPMKNMPDMFKKAGWDLLEVPRTTLPKDYPAFRSYEWLHMNVLSLDEKRVIVEKTEEPFIKALKDWGFEPIPTAFRNNYKHGGSFHCATVDIRRRGELKSYF